MYNTPLSVVLHDTGTFSLLYFGWFVSLCVSLLYTLSPPERDLSILSTFLTAKLLKCLGLFLIFCFCFFFIGT